MGTTGQSITLANSIIGVGILAMPFCFQQCGVLLAMLILLLMGLVSRLSSYFLLKAALIARRRNFEFLAFHVFGPAGKLAVEVGIIGFLMGTCIAYFVVVGDLGPQIISKMFNINQSDVLRTSIMVIVSLVCVLPLGLLRNVDSLSNVSAATIGFYLCLVMKVIVEAASQLLNSDWSSKVELWKPSGVLQCVPIFSMALFCQTQLFEIFESMPTLSLEKMNVVTKNAINICTSVYLTLGVFGYIAFCSQNISGNILVSLSPTMASDVIKLGFVMSLAFSFPLIIFPCRASLYSLMYRKVNPPHHDNIINHSIPEGTFRLITVSIIGVSLFISLMLPNIELVLGLLGSTIGVLVCMVFPAACFINVTLKNTNERVLAKVILILGLFILVLGTYANLQAAENKLDRIDDKYITQERIDKIVEEFFESKKLEISEEVIIKPMSKEKNGKSEESEIQPPNPIPPESHSKEKIEKPIVNGAKDIIKKDTPSKVIKDGNNQFDNHPKNLNNQLIDSKQSNGVAKEEPKDVKIAKPPSEQEKLDMIKQQKLIETIKQHGEEQKELIKEQKEILGEILKTKEELQKNQQEKIDSNEAKMIAVESIQKIANVALQSLGAASDKPVDKKNAVSDNKPKQNLEKAANEAVQEIAKKAVETIQAIKSEDKQNHVKPPQNVDNAIKDEKGPQEVNANIAPAVQLNNAPIVQLLPNNLKSDQVVQNNPNIRNIDPLKPHSHSPDEPQSYKQGEDMQNLNKNPQINTNINNGIIQNVPLPLAIHPNNQVNLNQNGNVGQNTGVNANVGQAVPKQQNNVVQNGGIQSNNMKNEINNIRQEILPNEIVNQKIAAAGKQENNINVRQKREVVDCTDRSVLKPEDKQICDTLIQRDKVYINKDLQDVLLPPINLGDLSRKLPLDNDIVHHFRSLKTVDNEKDR